MANDETPVIYIEGVTPKALRPVPKPVCGMREDLDIPRFGADEAGPF